MQPTGFEPRPLTRKASSLPLKPRSHFHGAVYGELRSITERRTVTLRRYPSTSAKPSGFFRRYPRRAVTLRRGQIYRDKKLSVRNFFGGAFTDKLLRTASVTAV